MLIINIKWKCEVEAVAPLQCIWLACRRPLVQSPLWHKKSEEINKEWETGKVNEVRQNRMHLNMDFLSRYTSELLFALMLKAKKIIDIEINGSLGLLVVHSLKFKEIRQPAKNCNWHSCVLIANIILSMYHSIPQRQTNNNFSHSTLCQRKTKGW